MKERERERGGGRGSHLDIKLLSEKFLLRQRVPGLSRDHVHRPLLQLALDGPVQDEQRLTCMLLGGGEGGRSEE